MRELQSIFPPKTQVNFGGKTVDIHSIALKQLPVVAEIAERVLDKVFFLLMNEKQGQQLDMEIAKEIIHILKNDIDLIEKLLEITTSVDKETIQSMSLEAGLFLLDNVLEVNKSFLYQNIMPMAKNLFQKYKPKKTETPATNG